MKKRQQFEQLLIEKAMKDTDFRQRLFENPQVVIKVRDGGAIYRVLFLSYMWL